MPKFRKKPVEIEALRVRDILHTKNDADLPTWVTEAIGVGSLARRYEKNEVKVITLEVNMVGNLNDWIVRDVKGELYPCKPDIFTATYEPVE